MPLYVTIQIDQQIKIRRSCIPNPLSVRTATKDTMKSLAKKIDLNKIRNKNKRSNKVGNISNRHRINVI